MMQIVTLALQERAARASALSTAKRKQGQEPTSPAVEELCSLPIARWISLIRCHI
jgi:hypothetical protein